MSNKNKTVVAELIEYFEQQLSLHRSSEIKYTTEEALVDAIQICKNALKTKEKSQIINTFKQAQILHQLNDETRAEQFYKNTFKD